MISVVVCLGFAEHELPASSYRLGVRSSPLHDLLPAHFTLALKQGLIHFNDQLSGFIDKRALLHGVEVRIFSNTCDFEHGVLISTSS